MATKKKPGPRSTDRTISSRTALPAEDIGIPAPVEVTFHFQELDGRKEIVGIEVWTTRTPDKSEFPATVSDLSGDAPAHGIQTADISGLARNFQLIARQLLARHYTPQPLERALSDTAPAKTVGRPRAYTDDDMRSALEIFERERRFRRSGTNGVAEAFGITLKAAETLVARSRKRLADSPAPAPKPPRKAAKKQPPRKGRT